MTMTLEQARRHIELVVRSSNLPGWKTNREAWDVLGQHKAEETLTQIALALRLQEKSVAQPFSLEEVLSEIESLQDIPNALAAKLEIESCISFFHKAFEDSAFMCDALRAAERVQAALAAGDCAPTQPSTSQAEVRPSMQFTLGQVETLLSFFGGSNADMTVEYFPAKHWPDYPEAPAGLYVYCTEYPDEGSQWLGAEDNSEEILPTWSRDVVEPAQAAQEGTP